MKGICFIEPMFHSVINGTKTQTRRIVKPQPYYRNENGKSYACLRKHSSGYKIPYHLPNGQLGVMFPTLTINDNPLYPSYQIGEKVYLKEPYIIQDNNYAPTRSYLEYKYSMDNDYSQNFGWENKLFMPAEYARYFIEITAVRCERLQDISELDARAEGIKSYWLTKEGGEGADDWHESNSPPFVGAAGIFHTRREAYQELWDILNAKRGFGWESNPYVWVYDFKLVK